MKVALGQSNLPGLCAFSVCFLICMGVGAQETWVGPPCSQAPPGALDSRSPGPAFVPGISRAAEKAPEQQKSRIREQKIHTQREASIFGWFAVVKCSSQESWKVKKKKK